MLSFDFYKQGEVIGVVGPVGSGKSALNTAILGQVITILTIAFTWISA